ncbi:MAG: SDR family NAD(P)-dependent oxidoreductase, partial [Clostridia bacterium]|nr:SDR family NAD(P)-dependent oxidoreductase [Clostridia bacterium]
MKNVCVITGGGSGMGLEAAKFMSKDKIIVLAGRTVAKLENAVNTLKELGFEAYAHACDTSDRNSVKALAEYAASLGEIKNVINSAGLSPNMAGQEKILRVNALGTVYINQEFSKLMKEGSVIVDVSSNSAYILPGFLINKKIYALAET